MTKIIQRIACKGLLIKDGRILLVREAATYRDGTNIGVYSLPGGRIDAGEPFAIGLRREVAEETGLEVVVGEPLFVGEWFPNIRGARHQIVAIFFVCQVVSGRVRLSDEHDAHVWVGPDQIDKYKLAEPDPLVFKAFRTRCGLPS